MILTEFERKKLRQLVAVALGDDTRALRNMRRDQSPCMYLDTETDIECWHGLLAKLGGPTRVEPNTKEIPPLIKMAEYELPPVKLDDYENTGVKHVEQGTLSSKETYFDTRAEFLPEELAALGITLNEYQASRDVKRLRCVHGLLFSEPCAACEKSVGGV